MAHGRLFLLTLMGSLASACGPLLGNQPSLAPTTSGFPDVFGAKATVAPAKAATGAATTPGATAAAQAPFDPFSVAFADASAATKFLPVFAFDATLTAGSSPALSTSVYQTGGELSVGEADLLIENASFRFDKLSEGQLVGGGQLDVGTPPKASQPVTVTVEETNNTNSAVVAIKSTGTYATIYIADMQITKVGNDLALISLSNASRAEAQAGTATVPHSVKITQTLDAGYFLLPSLPGNARLRVVLKSVPDPSNMGIAQKVINSTLAITAP